MAERLNSMAEPGELDNRLSLDPNDERWPFVLDWEDGQTYKVELTIRQVSPGEFEVLNAVDLGETEQTDEYAESEMETEKEPKPKSKQKRPANPAILAIIGKAA